MVTTEDSEPNPKPCCPACSRAFEKMSDYPQITVDSLEILPQMEPTPRSGFELTYPPLSAAEKLAANKPLNEYLDGLSCFMGETIRPQELFPPWKKNSYFTWAYEIPPSSWEPSQEQLMQITLADSLMKDMTNVARCKLLRQRYGMSIKDAKKFMDKHKNLSSNQWYALRAWQHEEYTCYLNWWDVENGLEDPGTGSNCHLTVCVNGPNFGSAGGPTLEAIGILAKLQYTGKLNG